MAEKNTGKIIETGDGLVVVISKELLAASEFKVGDIVNIYAHSGELVIADPSRPYYTAEELVAGITDETMHTFIDTGSPVGKELW